MALRGQKGLTGLNVVLANLNRQVMRMERRSVGGTRKAALIVRKRAQELVPRDTGKLVGSAYTQVWVEPSGPVAVIGFSAEYAIFVHEIDKNYTVGQWKYLETALKEKSREILAALRGSVRIR